MLNNLKNNKYGFIHRFSTLSDFEDINTLLKICFGNREKYGALDNLKGRYLLIFDKNKLIAITGIVDEEDSPFNGNEIDWTCCLPEYRNLGIITSALKLIMQDVKKDLYCSCYRAPQKEHANMHNIMLNLGFECVSYQYKTFDSRYFNACNDCNFRKNGICICHEDLYFKSYH